MNTRAGFSWVATLSMVLLLAGCHSAPPAPASEEKPPATQPDQTTQQDQATQPNQAVQPDIVTLLPEDIGAFHYQGFYKYPEPDMGYSIRYQLANGGYADVYVYPVPTQLRHHQQPAIIRIMTGAALKEIEYYALRGDYADFGVLTKSMLDVAGQPVARVDGTYSSDNLNLYTLVYLTEHSAKLLKVRLTVLDNFANRESLEWDNFVRTLFDLLVRNIEKA